MQLPEPLDLDHSQFRLALVGKGEFRPTRRKTFGIGNTFKAVSYLSRIAYLASDTLSQALGDENEIVIKGSGSKAALIYPGFGGTARILVIPKGEIQKAKHKEWSRRLSAIKPHPRSWGFARGKSCIDMCKAHSTYWGAEGTGDVSFLSMDLEGFFPSISGDMVANSMLHHGFSEQDVASFIQSCMLWTGSGANLIRSLQNEVIGSTPSFMSSASLSLNASISALLNNDWFRWNNDICEDIIQEKSDRNPEVEVQKHLDLLREGEAVVFESMLGMGPRIRRDTWVLPQGSSVSPPMSNIVCKIMDYRLSAYLEKCGCFYTRYADDITISWSGRKTKKMIGLISAGIKKIVWSEGFKVNRKKTLIMGPGMRQNILGYNMNSGRPTIPRGLRKTTKSDIDELVSGRESHLQFERDTYRLMGIAEYIGSAHPEEAERMKAKLKASISGDWIKSNRSVFIIEDVSDSSHENPIGEMRSISVGGGDEGWI